ncbi:MAG TPA: BadF/BadG/BcrA/BcrD ATPase family protein [Anaerolineaceae bacterium]|nr:BadF/BadG/BcrA/BcrD ATPase family protein [Anaerolineaceae bacterium]HPN52341.1 BadF/BadG/BcrA/BcrD ATPase family protein [Anaerolineaceae bacterium]
MIDQSSLVIGIDGGGSHTRAFLADDKGKVLGKGVSGPSNHNRVGDQLAEISLNDSIHKAFQQANIPYQPVRSICLGMAGADRPADRSWLETWARKYQIASRIICVNDGQILISAGTPDEWGCGLISGTGSLAVGISPDGKNARSGGWGYLAGDEGSGYWMGIQALQAITKSVDDRGPGTLLLELVLNFWKLENSSQLIPYIYGPNFERSEIARLARLVQSAAEQGDSIALAIESAAGQELARMVLSVTRKLNFGSTTPCAFGGGVLTRYPALQRITLNECLKMGLELSPLSLVEEPALGAVRIALQQG